MSIVLKAEKREQLGSSATKKIRKENRIPAVIYSKNGNINLSVDVKEFEHEYHKGNILTTLFELEFSEKKTKVIAHKVELDPVSDRPIHIDFLNCEESKIIRAKPRIAFINQDKSPGLKKGGFLHVVLRKVEIICKNEQSVPEKIEADIGVLHVGSKFRANNLKLPEGVELAEKTNFLIASIIGRGKSEDETANAAATTTVGAVTQAATTTATKTEEKKPAAKK
jgi:large subunit ribosomal protein L25